MQIWADVFDAAGNRLGEGPITSIGSAKITRVLDGAGEISLSLPLTDGRVNDLITNECRVTLWLYQANGDKRELGRGILRKLNGKDANELTLSPNGPDQLDELRRKSVLLARIYNGTAVNTAVAALVGLVSGWTVDTTGITGNLYARFDGMSVLAALQEVAKNRGLHFRLNGDKAITFGALGDTAPLRIIQAGQAAAMLNLERNDDVALIESLTWVHDSEAVANWIIPLGGGQGEAALTLKHCTRSIAGGYAYNVQTMTGPDGSTLYYLADATSIAAYGQIEKTFTCEITPVSHSSVDLTNAANALYDAAVAYLLRYKDKQTVYSVTLKKAYETLKPGQKVPLVYKGFVYDPDGAIVSWADLNTEFWITKVTESVSADGVTTSLEISNVDRAVEDTAAVIVGAIESVTLKNVQVQPYPAVFTYVYTDTVQQSGSYQRYLIYPAAQFGKNAKFTLPIDDSVLSIIRVKLTIKTRPLYVLDYTEAFHDLVNGSRPDTTRYYLVAEDTHYPTAVHLWINGSDVSTTLGGPWHTAGEDSALDVTLDVTDIILAAGTYGAHDIQVSCGDFSAPKAINVAGYAAKSDFQSHGIVEMTMQMHCLTQAIKLD